MAKNRIDFTISTSFNALLTGDELADLLEEQVMWGEDAAKKAKRGERRKATAHAKAKKSENAKFRKKKNEELCELRMEKNRGHLFFDDNYKFLSWSPVTESATENKYRARKQNRPADTTEPEYVLSWVCIGYDGERRQGEIGRFKTETTALREFYRDREEYRAIEEENGDYLWDRTKWSYTFYDYETGKESTCTWDITII